jgi:predicted ATPase
LDAYRKARRILVELGIEPGAELQDLNQAMLVHDPGLDPPRADDHASGRTSALPSPPNRTIGRNDDVRAVVERLRSESVRLLTLTGPGGVGKTRLALEAARAVEADFADGAGSVSLAAVERSQGVAPAIVNALGIIPLPGESADRAVERFLAAKHLLLLVDNCEHLPAAAPFIGGLPAACPRLTVLTTSRGPLSVQAEHLYPVSPLALPPHERSTDAEALAAVDAVTLFCERARAHDPGWELSDDTTAAVASICRRVDGLPLAIELAAARCGLLSPTEIVDRLDDALGALGAAPRDAPARQGTLRATIDWSYALLSEDEKACFARFAVFAGGASVEAAETITGAGIDTLDRLVAKSLLVRRREADGSTRLGMLETIREYAGERFATVAERETVRERHYRLFLALAQRHGADEAILGPERNEQLRRLDGEVENIYAALEWALEQDTCSPALELTAVLGEYWMARNRYADAVAFIERALSKPGADRAPKLRIRALCRKAWALWPLGHRAQQAAASDEAEATARTLADPAVLADVLYQRAALESYDTQRLDLATALADEALACARAAEDPWLLAMAAWARALTSGPSELRERVEHAASLLQAAGNVFHLAGLFEMGVYRALCNGSDGDARDFASRAVPLSRALEDRLQWMLLQRKVGLAALFSGDTQAARDAFREQLELCRDVVVLPAAKGVGGLAAVAAVCGDLDRAARLFGAAAAHRYGEPENAIDARLRATFFEPARTRRGADAWDAGVREGAALSFDAAIAYALDDSDTDVRDSGPQPAVTASATR